MLSNTFLPDTGFFQTEPGRFPDHYPVHGKPPTLLVFIGQHCAFDESNVGKSLNYCCSSSLWRGGGVICSLAGCWSVLFITNLPKTGIEEWPEPEPSCSHAFWYASARSTRLLAKISTGKYQVSSRMYVVRLAMITVWTTQGSEHQATRYWPWHGSSGHTHGCWPSQSLCDFCRVCLVLGFPTQSMACTGTYRACLQNPFGPLESNSTSETGPY